jgi:hypothetical protein
MKKIILKHLTVTGYMKAIDLTDSQLLVKKLEDARNEMQNAKKKVKAAKQELNQALEDSIRKIEDEKVTVNKIQNIEGVRHTFPSVFKNKEFKAKYEKKLASLEEKKNDIKQKLEEYKSDGTAKWELFKNELYLDLEEIERTVKNFIEFNVKKVKKVVS